MAVTEIGDRSWDFAEADGQAIDLRRRGVPVEMPTRWRLFGPLDEDTTETVWTKFFRVAGGHKARSRVELDIDRHRNVPDQLEIGGRVLEGRDVTLRDGVLDLSAVFGGHGNGQQAFMFAEIDVPADGEVALGAGTDYWMRWWVDGALVLDTMAAGNVAHPIGHVDQCFRRELKAGKHLLAVHLVSGTASWIFKARTATPADEAMSALNEVDYARWGVVPELNAWRPPRPNSNWEWVTAIRSDVAYADVAVECRYQQYSPQGNFGIVIGAQDSDRYYYAYVPVWGQLWRARGFWAAIAVTDGCGHVRNIELKLMHNVPAHQDMWRTLKVERKGNEIQMWVHGVRGPRVRDETYGAGRVGIAGFGDFLVRDVEIEAEQEVEGRGWTAGGRRGASWCHVEEDVSLGDFQHPGQMILDGDQITLPLVIGRNESCHKLNDSNSAVYLYRSGDLGRSWERFAGPIARRDVPEGTRFLVEPGVIRSVHFKNDERCFVIRESRDGEETWSEPMVGRLAGDWEKMFAANARNGASGYTQLNDGTLVVNIGHDYVGLYDSVANVGEGTWGTGMCQPYCTMSRDGGMTWDEPVPLDHAANRMSAEPDGHCCGFSETTSAQLPDGKIVAIARPYRSPFMWQTESADGGKTWRQACYAPFSGAGAPVMIGTRSGYLAVIKRGPGDGLHCSYDGGLNWDAGTMIDYNGLFNGSAIEAEADVMLTAYPQSMDEIRPAYARVQRIRISPDGPVALLD